MAGDDDPLPDAGAVPDGSVLPDGDVPTDAPADAPADAPIDQPDPTQRCAIATPDRQWGTSGDDFVRVALARSGDLLAYGYTGATPSYDALELRGPHGDTTGFLQQLRGGAVAFEHLMASTRPETIDAVSVQDDRWLLAVRQQRDGVFVTGIAEMAVGGSHHVTLPQWFPATLSSRTTRIAKHGARHALLGLVDATSSAPIDATIVQWTATPSTHTRFVVDAPQAITVTDGFARANGDLVVGGSRTGSAGPEAYVARYAGGTTLEDYVLISQGAGDEVRAVRELPGGDVLIAGTTTRPLAGDPSSYVVEDAFVARYDATLTQRRWVRQLGSDKADVAIDLAVDAATGRSWLVGESTGADGSDGTHGGMDAFVVALEADGSVRWTRQLGSWGDERPTSIVVDPCENVFVAGTTDGVVAGTQALGGRDAFLVTVTPPSQ